MHHTELGGVNLFIGNHGLSQLVGVAQLGSKYADFLRQCTSGDTGNLVFGGLVARPFTQGKQVVGATCLGAGANHGTLPAAEGLAAHNSTGDTAVDICVTDLDIVQPVLDFCRV